MAGVTVLYTGPYRYHKKNHNKRRRNILSLALVALLCVVSYFLGIWQHSRNTTGSSISAIFSTISCKYNRPVTASSPSSFAASSLDFTAHHTVDESPVLAGSTKRFQPCDVKYSEYTPCEDRDRSLKFPREKLIYRERHCPAKKELLKCLIPAPPGYRNPFPWPASRGMAWFANVPHKELTVEKAVQNWIRVDGDKFRFPGGGTMFPNGADAYIDDIDRLISLKDGSIRTALDTGCGVSLYVLLTCIYKHG